jgi:hypothetical protein
MVPAVAGSMRTTRRAVVAALLTSLVGGELHYARRKERYLRSAARHRLLANLLSGRSERDRAFRRYHLELARRYERAAYFPWVRVAPIPPPAGSR